LGKYVPFWDREIEAIILSHPQLDHYGGLIDVVRSYKIDNFLASALDSEAEAYQELKKEVEARGIKVANPNEYTVVRYGDLYIDIVYPSQGFLARNSVFTDVASRDKVLGSYTSRKDPNEYSTVAILSFGDFDALLTGDIVPDVIPEVIAGGQLKDVEYLKVPHHGSKNGLTPELLNAVRPELAVISVGENNRFGHPHSEVLKLLEESGVEILRTDELGSIEILTDGNSWWLH
jgi:competence protein ComEC